MTLDDIAADLALGGTVTIPWGDYWVPPGAGLMATQPGTRVVMEPGAVFRLQPSDLSNGQILALGDRCTLEGGVTVGDVANHIGTAGEWLHNISIRGKGVRIIGHEARAAWGDGFNVALGADDPQLIDCVADSNRRQGASLTGGARPIVAGGRYINTGLIAFTGPGAGIDVEPNPGSYSVEGFHIRDVEVSGNAGPGILMVRASGTTCSGTVDRVTSVGNRTGITVSGTAGVLDVTVRDCIVTDSTQQGIISSAPGLDVHGGKVLRSGDIGIYLLQPARLSGLRVAESGHSGVRLDGDADGSDLSDLLVEASGRALTNTYQEVHINGASGVRMRGVFAYPATTGNRSRYGMYVAGSAARLIGCDATAGTQGRSYTLADAAISPAFV